MKIKDSEKRDQVITVDYFRPENQPQALRPKRNDFGHVLNQATDYESHKRTN